ncbi:diacylglycerol/lipid kinase family protein [Halorarius litoreus]|uniref:diacylglycerol/lipid kinase family protein n=1 Tax=Halorarius litoreus TaxID=2962676 RepID=UPI0020CE638C|nr:YegS/Rv2252/BmrU family lipid kinase [Halorarius litoreus]
MRVLVRNPNSGDRETSKRAARLAKKRGFDVRASAARGETRSIAAEAAAEPDVTQVVACGGDGTLNEVVRGVADADALADVEIGVVPAGTGNNFAENVGIPNIETAFEVLRRGERRRLDLGWVAEDDRPFINSCVGGLTAESSAKTTPASKKRLGVLAYVLRTLAETRTFEGLKLDVRAGDAGDQVWTGEAIMLLVGNGRRFPGERMRQANMEDGRCNVVIIERRPAMDYLTRGAADRLLRKDATHLTRLKVSRLDVTHDGDPAVFSLDGEIFERNALTLRSRPGAMRFRVGEGYEPTPPEWGKSKGN